MRTPMGSESLILGSCSKLSKPMQERVQIQSNDGPGLSNRSSLFILNCITKSERFNYLFACHFDAVYPSAVFSSQTGEKRLLLSLLPCNWYSKAPKATKQGGSKQAFLNSPVCYFWQWPARCSSESHKQGTNTPPPLLLPFHSSIQWHARVWRFYSV